jgi:A/G-specific adenine glycosylase
MGMSAADSPPPPSLDPAAVASLRRLLLRFFDAEARELPWRDTRDPYPIWVSEIMSQQTRVETVVPYWRSWMEAYPTVEALAEADEGSVLKAWEGLGYYSRARNLHRAARMVRESLGGRLPASRDELRTLPGIGSYTAGAVASIAFGEAVPAVDGNVRRVTSRLLDWPAPTPAELEEEAARWVPDDRPGDFNQALMELGATVCTPRAPQCGECPVASLCRALAAGTVTERPAPRRRGAVRTAEEAVTVAWRPGAAGVDFALRQRPADGLLGGLYEFPGTPLADGESGPEADGLNLPRVPHTFSHLRVTYHPVLVGFDRAAAPPGGASWFGPEELGALPLPVAQQSILAHARAALDRLGVIDLDPPPTRS